MLVIERAGKTETITAYFNRSGESAAVKGEVLFANRCENGGKQTRVLPDGTLIIKKERK